MRRAATEYYHDTQESPITIEIVKLLKTERVELQLVRMAGRSGGGFWENKANSARWGLTDLGKST